MAVAAAHADGKESYARGIATELLEDFLAVEERFAAAREATEQEVIDSLRQVRLCSRAIAGTVTVTAAKRVVMGFMPPSGRP